MFKIVRMPSSLKSSFRFLTTPLHWDRGRYLAQLVLAIAISWGERNAASLYRHLDASTHRTRFNSFLNIAQWDPAALLQRKAYGLLGRLDLKEGQTMHLVIDVSYTPNASSVPGSSTLKYLRLSCTGIPQTCLMRRFHTSAQQCSPVLGAEQNMSGR